MGMNILNRRQVGNIISTWSSGPDETVKSELSFVSFHSPEKRVRPQVWSGSRRRVCLSSGLEVELINTEQTVDRENMKRCKRDTNGNGTNEKASFAISIQCYSWFKVSPNPFIPFSFPPSSDDGCGLLPPSFGPCPPPAAGGLAPPWYGRFWVNCCKNIHTALVSI